MVTLRFDFHMGSVEFVTCHVPESQSVVGGVQTGWGRSEVVGGRKESEWAILELVGRRQPFADGCRSGDQPIGNCDSYLTLVLTVLRSEG